MIILGTNSIKAAGGFNVANSYRSGVSGHYLLRNKTTATNVADLTISVWVKRSKLTDKTCIISSWGGDTNNTGSIFFTDGDKLTFEAQTGGSYSANGGVRKITTQVFRDVSSWSHLVFQKDDGVYKIYHNGTEITAFDTNTQSSGTNVFSNASGNTTVGNENLAASDHDFQGYIAEAVLIDGQALAPTSFGEFDSDSNIWKPINVSGLTFGNNGFYLDFEDSSAMGNDASGGTDFTLENVSAIDQSTDTCTNNFATLNPLIFESSSNTFAEGNLKITGGGSDSWTTHYGLSTIAVSTGKWFVESKVTTVQSAQAILGIISTSQALSGSLKDFGTVCVEKSGRITGGGNNLQTGLTAFSNGDIAGAAFDATNGTVQFYRNGSAYGNAVSSIASDTYYFATTTYQSGGVIEFNFGSPPYSESGGNSDGDGFGNFSMAVPSGYFALNTKNLAEYG